MSLFLTGIRPVIDNHLIEEAKKERDYGDYWSASSAGYCMRKQIFQRLGVPPTKEPDPRKQRVFSAGHIFHDWLQELTRKAGISIAQEVELQDEDLMVRGHFDDLVLLQEPVKTKSEMTPREMMTMDVNAKHLILYDYKTVNSRSFTYSKGREMSYYHKMQLGTYMYMLRKQVLDLRAEEKKLMFGKEPSEDVDALESLGWRIGSLPTKELLTEARILKISKDDLRQEEQQLLWSPEPEKEVLDYWAVLNVHWRTRTIPPCTCSDHENGFLAKEAYNDYFYDGEPCSLAWMNKTKEEGLWQHPGVKK